MKKNVPYLTTEAKQSFASAIQSLGKHCFLPSLANRMIRMSKDDEMRKQQKEQCTGRESGRK